MEPSSMDVETPEQSVTTVEIRIRTLDSSNYTVRVDKDVPVPTLKDQLAPVVGVPSQDQRLICRGRVLKDDQLLSSYNVEDGHVLHLVARPPAPLLEEAAPAQEAPNESRRAGISHSVVVGTINIPEMTEVVPELSRILSAVFGAGAAGTENRRGVAVMQVSAANAPSAATSTTIPPASTETRRQEGIHFRNIEIVPDALTTISQYLTRMEQAFADNGYRNAETSAAEHSASSSASSRPLPTPASLGAAVSRVQDLLHGQASVAFASLARRLEDESNLVTPAARSDLQSTAVWSGNIMQQLGALLMELGRTTLTMRLGPSSAQAIVNSGPAVFVSPTGPNPMMVQPFPFQTGVPLGALSLGAGGQVEQVATARTVSTTNDATRRMYAEAAAAASATNAELRHTLHATGALHAGGEQRQADDASRAQPSEQELDNLGLLLQDNGTVRLLPVRARTASVNVHSSVLRSIRSSSEAVHVPVLGIRAQVHAHPWTHAVLQATEGQRPVGIAVTIPVDVTSARANTQGATADTGIDSVSNANRDSRGEGEVSEQGVASINNRQEQTLVQQTDEQTDERTGPAARMDRDNSTSQVASGDADERSSRKRNGPEEATDGAESCMSTSPEYEENQRAQGSDSKRRKVDHGAD